MLPLLHSRNASGKSIEAKNLNNSGQAVSFDVLIAVSLFLVILATTLTIWQNQNQESENQLILQDMQAAGARTLDFLVRSQGETITGTTNNWEEETIDNTKFIGLAKIRKLVERLIPPSCTVFMFTRWDTDMLQDELRFTLLFKKRHLDQHFHRELSAHSVI